MEVDREIFSVHFSLEKHRGNRGYKFNCDASAKGTDNIELRKYFCFLYLLALLSQQTLG